MKMLRLTIVLAAAIPLFAQSDVTLQRAIRKETVEGDLKGAIELYRKAAAEAGKDRTTGAQALLHLAQCYERQGNAEARATYERVVREFADQKEAVATAIARLGAGARPTEGMVTRQVWTGSKVDTLGAISPDGRSLSFVGWNSGNLAVHDLATGDDRHLTTSVNSHEFALQSTISRDGKIVAYAWFNKEHRYELRLANLSGEPNPRRLFGNEDVEWIGPHDFSPDGKWIAVQIGRMDKTSQIGLVSTTDGSLRVLKSVDWRGTSKMFFARDGKYLAYDLPQSESVEQRDIFLLAIDGSRDVPTVVHPATLLGWAPDGKQLLFGSDRTGTIGVWTLAVLDGKIQGSPELIKPAIGQVVSLGLAQSGALYFGLMSGVRDVYVASIDFTSGELVSPPTRPVQSFIGNNNFPDWSPDGKHLSYTSQRGSVQLLALRSVETGKTRELRPNLLDIYGRRYWSPDGRSIAATARDPKGRHGVYRIDVETGEAALIALSDPGAYSAPVGWSPDAQKLYYRRWDPTAKASHVTERELASGKERDVLTQAHGLSALSPDGRQLAFVKSDRSTRSSMLRVIPVEGGQPEELVRVQSPESIDSSLNSNYSNLEWTPDGRSVIFRKDNGQQHELWLVSLADGKSRKLPIDLPVRQVRVHPDGRRITFLSGNRTREVWVMENFLPTLSAKK